MPKLVRRAVPIERARLAAAGDLRSALWIAWSALLALALPERSWSGATDGLLRLRRRLWGAPRINPLRALRGVRPELTSRDCDHLADALETGRREVVAQCIRMRLPGGWTPGLRLEGEAALTEALRGGRGVILWVAHFVHSPNIVKLAMRDAGVCLHHLSRPEHGFSATAFGKRFLNPIRTRAEDRILAGRIVHRRDRPAHSVLAALRVLRGGEALSMTAGAWEGGTLVRCALLGHALTVSAAPVWLAQRSGAPLFPVFAVREPTGGFVVHVAPPLEVPTGRTFREVAPQVVAGFVQGHEPWILRYPEQWRGWRSLEGVDR